MEHDSVESVEVLEGLHGIPAMVLRPVVVGSMWTHGAAGSDEVSESMFIVIDLDQVPALSRLFERQREGEEFDLITRWGVGTIDDSQSPYSFFEVYFPTEKLGIC